MTTSLSKSIKECIENRDKQNVDRLFDRMHSAVEEFMRQDTTPLPYSFQSDEEPVDSFSETLQFNK